MFTFFHRKPTIVVDCFSVNSDAFEYAPIVQTRKTLPDWWKNLPNLHFASKFPPSFENNMKTCYGFNELYKRGFVLESWSDYKIQVRQDSYEYYYSNFEAPVEHGRVQFEGSFNNHFHLKLNSPWFIREKKGVHFAFIGAEWALDNYDFKVLPGIVEFRHTSQTNVNIMLIKKPDPYIIDIKMGQPLAQLIPLRDDLNYEYKIHLITREEYNKFFPKASGAHFAGVRSPIQLGKRNDKREQSKCPFR
jgi:hypothetical protein